MFVELTSHEGQTESYNVDKIVRVTRDSEYVMEVGDYLDYTILHTTDGDFKVMESVETVQKRINNLYKN